MLTELEYKDKGLAREIIHQDDEILVGTVMAADGDCYDNLRPLFKELAILPVQTHSSNVVIVEGTEGETRATFEDTDGLISFRRGEAVGVVTADCVPILVFAPDIRAVGAIHAGWKGTEGGIVDKALDILIDRGADCRKLMVWFGPSISREMYEVDEGLAERFRAAGFEEYVKRKDKPHIDLQGVNAERFFRRGVKRENLHLHEGCSFSSRYEDGRFRYQSHRRSGGKAGRMVSYIKLL